AGIGDVPGLMTSATECTQEVHAVWITLAQRPAVAHARHLRGAGLAVADSARNVREILRVPWIGDVDDRGAVELLLSGERIERFRVPRAPAVMADIGDVAPALLEDGRLIGAARLQVVVADKPHVLGFRRITDLGHLQPGLR